MAYEGPHPFPVPSGGTGATTLTDHGVLVGSGTGAITPLSVGATGTVLAGTTGSDPSFTATPDVTSISFGGGDSLSAYDEGTWTPALAFGGGTTGITYSLQTGVYTRIGNIVVAAFQIKLTNKGSSTGSATITGIPFSTTANGNLYLSSIGFGLLTLDTNYTMGLIRGATSASNFELVQTDPTGGIFITIDDTNFANTTSIIGNLTYTT